MGTVTEAGPATRAGFQREQRILLHDISWGLYETLRDCRGTWSAKMTYDHGALEIMSPSGEHERDNEFTGQFIKEVALGLDKIEAIEAYGATTWKRETAERGVEADECFYFDPEKLAIFEGRQPDREDDPMPDLVVEVELSSPLLDKMAIYAILGVPEIWRYDGQALRIVHLWDDGAYHLADRSRFLPVSAAEAQHWIGLAKTLRSKAWTQRLRAWIRDELAPRPRPD